MGAAGARGWPRPETTKPALWRVVGGGGLRARLVADRTVVAVEYGRHGVDLAIVQRRHVVQRHSAGHVQAGTRTRQHAQHGVGLYVGQGLQGCVARRADGVSIDGQLVLHSAKAVIDGVRHVGLQVLVVHGHGVTARAGCTSHLADLGEGGHLAHRANTSPGWEEVGVGGVDANGEGVRGLGLDFKDAAVDAPPARCDFHHIANVEAVGSNGERCVSGIRDGGDGLGSCESGCNGKSGAGRYRCHGFGPFQMKKATGIAAQWLGFARYGHKKTALEGGY